MFSQGVSIPYEHITMFQKLSWGKTSTVQNRNVSVPRKSMKTIVLLFRDDSTEEEFVYPNLKTVNVKISIGGKPNKVYSRDLTRSRLYEEAHRLFSTKMKYDQNISVLDFYDDSFACVIDLRTHENNMIYKSGKPVMNMQSGILLELTKSATTSKDHTIYVFVVSDGLVNFINNDLQSIQC